MSLYYQEKIQRRKLPFIAGLLALALMLIMVSSWTRQNAVGRLVTLVDGMLFVLFLALTVRIIHSSKKQMKYSLVQDELIIQEVRAGRKKVQDRIHLNQIISFQPVSFIRKLNCIGKDSTCLIHHSYELNYKANEKNRSVIIRPSDRLAKAIQKELKQLSLSQH